MVLAIQKHKFNDIRASTFQVSSTVVTSLAMQVQEILLATVKYYISPLNVEFLFHTM